MPHETFMAAALEGKELAPLVTGNHVALREVQRFLANQRIASVVGSEQDEDEAAVHAKFFLMIASSDVDTARRKLEERWQSGVAKEGLQLADVTAAGEGTCPACGAAVPEAASECPDCGLFLG